VSQDESELVPARQRRPGRPDRLPATALVTVALATVVLLEVHAVGYAFTLVGLDPAWASAVLVASLVGSFVDIPIARLRPRAPQVRFRLVPWFGTVYIVPVAQRRIAVTVSLNVGGAVVPTVVSGYVVARLGLWLPATVAVAVVAAVVHATARPVRGLGIEVPLLVPALVAALAAVVLRPDDGTAALAYVAGTIGTLVGGDLTHLRVVRDLDTSAVSIGGAGTFDGVFLSGVLAVLLGALL
jgi:uncharacterized membrane protein